MADYVERRWTSRDGLSLYARDYAGAAGAARLPVICLHGLTRNSKDFEALAPLIAAAGRRVIVPDVRGRGLSDRDPDPANYVPNTYARDIIRLLDLLGMSRALFVGTSMGGIISLAISGMRRRMVAGLVLNDVGPEVCNVGIDRIKSYVGKKVDIGSWDDAAAYLRRINGVAFPDYTDRDWADFARRTFAETNGAPHLDYDPAIMQPLSENRYKAMTFVAWYLFRRLARSAPVLLVRGELSDLLSKDIADKMQRRAPAMRRVEIPRVGHAPMLTEPQAVDAITAFLQTAP
ncbi:MAG TPA: alpha/beta hydrolase [Sphingomicrobium sp.]|nr:alpha/beta hydrolase [Sphingomicrobium sp.]